MAFMADKQMLVAFRKEGTVTRLAKPTNLKRARALGYTAKQGVVMARVRIRKGARKRPKTAGGRRPKRFGSYFTLGKSKRQIAEEKAARKFPNLEVLNSYLVGEDGIQKWFECILIDGSHPVIRSDTVLSSIAGRRGRASRGLTSAGKKSRGLRK